MTMITLDDAIKEEERLLRAARTSLQNLREEIEELREKLGCGDTSDVAKAAAEIKKLAPVYTSSVETENRLGNLRERKAGIAQNGHAFDLEAARDSIGSKLDSLRDAARTGAVS